MDNTLWNNLTAVTGRRSFVPSIVLALLSPRGRCDFVRTTHAIGGLPLSLGAIPSSGDIR